MQFSWIHQGSQTDEEAEIIKTDPTIWLSLPPNCKLTFVEESPQGSFTIKVEVDKNYR